MHSHLTLESVFKIIDQLILPETVKEDIKNIYSILAEAESKAHNQPVGMVHFHEVGMKDAIMDIAAACLCIYELRPNKIYASPICTGYGSVRCAHGILPVPAPATLNILEGIPSYQGDIRGELLTPTGAAILKYFVDEFTQQPEMIVEKSSYGMGKKEYKRLNALRAIIGQATSEPSNDTVVLLECTVDDMTGEEMGYAFDKLLEEGARDVFLTPIIMKKNRPGILFSVLTDEEHKDDLIYQLFRVTTTLGIRESTNKRYILNRKIEEVDFHGYPIRKKVSSGYSVIKNKFEYEDCKNLADSTGIDLIFLKELLDKY